MIVSKLFGARKSSAIGLSAPAGTLTVATADGWPLADSNTPTPSEALKLSAVYGAVDYICNFIAPLPMYVYSRSTRERVKDHPLRQMLSVRPNEVQTPTDYKRMMTRCLELRGNAYAYIYRDPSSARPREVIPLLPDHMTLQLEDGRLWYYYTHPTSGKLYRLSREDVLHYKCNSDDGYVGVSTLKYAARSLQVARGASEYELAVYNNGARPSGVLSTTADLGGLSEVPDPDDNTRFLSKKENIRRAWESVFAGSANAFRTAVLDNDLKYQPITVSSFDAQFIAARDVTVADIARFFGVPLHALMTGKQSFESNEQNSLEFIQGKGLALIRTMEEEDTYKLLLDSEIDSGLWIKRNFDARLRGDTKTRAEFYRTMRDIGAYSVNDIRALEDLQDVDGGDVRIARLDGVPLEDFRRISLARNVKEE